MKQASAERAAKLHAQGIALLQQGSAAGAVTALERAVGLAPATPSYLANLAEAHRRAGNPQAGAAQARRALALEPDHRVALINLGCCLFALGDHAGALASFERVAARAPGDAQAMAYRADALRELGRVRAAIEAYQRAIEIDPSFAHAHANLGPLLIAVGRPDDALAHCQRAVELSSGSAESLLNLGRCYFELGRLDEAMDAYGEAYERDPGSATLCCNVGEVWRACADPVQAALWFDKALALEPGRVDARVGIAALKTDHSTPSDAVADLQAILAEHPDAVEAHAALARAYWEDGDAAEAVAGYGRATALRPEFAQLQAAMGQVLASAGDIDAAIAAYGRALEVNPNCVGALYGFATTLGGKADPAHIARIEMLLADERTREGQRAMLHNALAHYFDGAGDFAAAARHATEANALQWRYKSQRGWNYDPEQHRANIDRLIAAFTPEFFARSRTWGLDDEAPVFVVGMPRSGTTLTEQILASHPRVLGVGERNFCMRGAEEAMRDPEGGALRLPDAAKVRAAAGWHREQLAKLVAKSGRDPGQIDRIVDKMPDNYSLLGWIVTLFPRARIIHSRRDWRDVALSCWMTHFGQIEWACRFDHIAARMREYGRIMAHWRSVLPVPMLEIDYEALVADQEGVSRRLVQWIGLEWDPRCLEFYRSDRLVRTASVTQVRQPLYRRAVARWRGYEKELGGLFAAIAAETG